MNEKVSIPEIAETLFPILPEFTPAEQKLSLQIFALLSQGAGLTGAQIATAARVPTRFVETFLAGHPGAYFDRNGVLVGYLGLAVRTMPHRFKVKERDLFTWCAWDSLFIPELLAETAHVTSQEPGREEMIRLTVTPSGISASEPTEAAMSVLLPDLGLPGERAKMEKDIISSFCHHVHFFSSRDRGEAWAQDRTGKYTVVSVAEGFELGRLMNQRLHGDALADRPGREKQ